jgi:hypothetical protein
VPLPPPVQRIIDWLRAGYPEGVPPRDYVPLFALLSRRLSTEEVEEIAAQLQREGKLDAALDHRSVVRQAVAAVTNQPVLDADVARVQDHLIDVGWADEWSRLET